MLSIQLAFMYIQFLTVSLPPSLSPSPSPSLPPSLLPIREPKCIFECYVEYIRPKDGGGTYHNMYCVEEILVFTSKD